MPTATRALLADGRVVTIRQLGPADAGLALRLHTALPERDQYTRFFTVHPAGLDRLVSRMTAGGDGHDCALGAFLGEELVGMASFAVLANANQAEIALVVNHSQQTNGVGTLLLEHLGSAARARGVRRFVAEVLTENTVMLRVFRDSGFPAKVRCTDTTCEVTLELTGGYPAAVGERERRAETASLGALLRPASVAVVGASRRRDAIGNAVLRNVLASRFAGACYPVNPKADRIEGILAIRSVAELPAGVDLAVLCVPAEAVPAAAEECGRRGVRALVVITAGLTGRPELVDGLLAAIRRYGMRLVGPNCLGIVNTDGLVRLSATFARGRPPAGRVGVVTQSGGMAIALLDQLAAVGLGVSTMVSTGDKYDVSGHALTGVLVQPMVEPGRELLVGVHGDATFGPLVVLGVGGVDTDLVADRASRLVPLTGADAAEMLTSLRASPILFGEGAKPLATAALIDVLLRVARMADLLPEIAEADLNPIVLTDRSCLAVDARIRVEPAEPADPYLRRLRS